MNTGQFGIGIVIDFFGFSSKASGFPVDFTYPSVTTLVPANIAVIKMPPILWQAGRVYPSFSSPQRDRNCSFNPKIMRVLPCGSPQRVLMPQGPGQLSQSRSKDPSLGAKVQVLEVARKTPKGAVIKPWGQLPRLDLEEIILHRASMRPWLEHTHRAGLQKA